MKKARAIHFFVIILGSHLSYAGQECATDHMPDDIYSEIKAPEYVPEPALWSGRNAREAYLSFEAENISWWQEGLLHLIDFRVPLSVQIAMQLSTAVSACEEPVESCVFKKLAALGVGAGVGYFLRHMLRVDAKHLEAYFAPDEFQQHYQLFRNEFDQQYQKELELHKKYKKTFKQHVQIINQLKQEKIVDGLEQEKRQKVMQRYLAIKQKLNQ